jgi:hypothetical protein
MVYQKGIPLEIHTKRTINMVIAANIGESKNAMYGASCLKAFSL